MVEFSTQDLQSFKEEMNSSRQVDCEAVSRHGRGRGRGRGRARGRARGHGRGRGTSSSRAGDNDMQKRIGDARSPSNQGDNNSRDIQTAAAHTFQTPSPALEEVEPTAQAIRTDSDAGQANGVVRFHGATGPSSSGDFLPNSVRLNTRTNPSVPLARQNRVWPVFPSSVGPLPEVTTEPFTTPAQNQPENHGSDRQELNASAGIVSGRAESSARREVPTTLRQRSPIRTNVLHRAPIIGGSAFLQHPAPQGSSRDRSLQNRSDSVVHPPLTGGPPGENAVNSSAGAREMAEDPHDSVGRDNTREVCGVRTSTHMNTPAVPTNTSLEARLNETKKFAESEQRMNLRLQRCLDDAHSKVEELKEVIATLEGSVLQEKLRVCTRCQTRKSRSEKRPVELEAGQRESNTQNKKKQKAVRGAIANSISSAILRIDQEKKLGGELMKVLSAKI